MGKHHRRASDLDVLRFIGEHAAGVGVVDVAQALGVSRSTAQRMLGRVVDANVGVRCEVEGRGHRYNAERGRLSAEQRWALATTRDLLVGLNGSALVAALDRIIDGETPSLPLAIDEPRSAEDPTVAQAVYEAARRRKRVRVDYCGDHDLAPRPRHLELHELRLNDGSWYATASDLDDGGQTKTFKLARMSNAVMTGERATHHVDVRVLYEHSVGVWDGPLVDVVVRLDGSAARHAHEYKLNVTQRETPDGDGVIVRARVAGLSETARWVWRWGRHARALSPLALVALCADELRAAAERYASDQ